MLEADLVATLTSTPALTLAGAVVTAVGAYFVSRWQTRPSIDKARDEAIQSAYKMGDELRDELREDLTEYQTNTKSEAARKAAIDEMSYNAQLAGYEAKYPALNPEHEDFDEDKTDEVATLLNAFVKAGQKRADALAKADRKSVV